MEYIQVNGGTQLKGSVKVGGAKNAVLPAIAATLLAEGTSIVDNVPHLEDVRTIANVLRQLGCDVIFRDDRVTIDAGVIRTWEAPYALVRQMRASILIMGALLGRMGRARISLPGGCAIGTRPIDLHLKGFTILGANITAGHGYVEAKVPKGQRLQGGKIYLDYPSVGATENIMMAASLAKGVTYIENAAEEPEIVDLANMLNSMNAKITGAGTDTIKIVGVDDLAPTQHAVIPDRIEAGTYMVAVAMTGGDVTIENVVVDHLRSIVAKLSETGAFIAESDEALRVIADGTTYPVDIKTLPYPGFPTDMQPQMMALLTKSVGTSIISETVFENRFMHVDEFLRMGANIRIDGRTAIVKGVNRLYGAPVNATDLRAGAALILAGLAAEGTTRIAGVCHIDRGYTHIEEKLQGLGANIQRVND